MMQLISSGLLFSLVILSFNSHANIKKNDLSEKSLLIELTGHDQEKKTEENFYKDILASYQKNDFRAVKSISKQFLKKYPQGIYSESALYLTGKAALENKMYGEAIKNFNLLLKKYPTGSKVIATHFAKAQTFEKMNLKNLAIQTYINVKSKYPGSPESFRADTQLKLNK